jgi:hypothetical protein
LTGIKKNTTIMRLPDGRIVTDKTLNEHPVRKAGWWKKRGATALVGHQIRYVYFIDPAARSRLTVPELPYSEIGRRGAGMYLGKKKTSAGSADSGTPGIQPGGGGANPTSALSTTR